MKVEEKMKKNKNCELSHMIRPAKSLEVYKQKQNILFIYESEEHRRSKVTWARLWVCTAECACRAYARPSAWPSARAYVCTVECIRARGSVVRDARLGYSLCTTRTSVRLGWSGRDARIGCTRAKLYGYD